MIKHLTIPNYFFQKRIKQNLILIFFWFISRCLKDYAINWNKYESDFFISKHTLDISDYILTKFTKIKTLNIFKLDSGRLPNDTSVKPLYPKYKSLLNHIHKLKSVATISYSISNTSSHKLSLLLQNLCMLTVSTFFNKHSAFLSLNVAS